MPKMVDDRDHQLLSTTTANGIAVCEVCPHCCTLHHGQTGRCRVRVNLQGQILPIPGQAVVALGTGTVEEHPLYHFYPGMRTLCVGSSGCTAACDFCQNWELALAPHHNISWPPLIAADPKEIVNYAGKHDCKAISFTYNEGIVWPEFMVEVMALGHQYNLKNVLVTNGFVSKHTWSLLMPWLDGIKLDLKGSNNQFYNRIVKIDMQSIIYSLNLIRQSGVWNEISTVIIPGINDSPENIEEFIEIILTHCSTTTPWHLMRFFPAYRMLDQQTGNIDDLRNIRQIAQKKGLAHVYISNIPGIREASSYCPVCLQLISIRGLENKKMLLPSKCPNCSQPVVGRGLV